MCDDKKSVYLVQVLTALGKRYTIKFVVFSSSHCDCDSLFCSNILTVDDVRVDVRSNHLARLQLGDGRQSIRDDIVAESDECISTEWSRVWIFIVRTEVLLIDIVNRFVLTFSCWNDTGEIGAGIVRAWAGRRWNFVLWILQFENATRIHLNALKKTKRNSHQTYCRIHSFDMWWCCPYQNSTTPDRPMLRRFHDPDCLPWRTLSQSHSSSFHLSDDDSVYRRIVDRLRRLASCWDSCECQMYGWSWI